MNEGGQQQLKIVLLILNGGSNTSNWEVTWIDVEVVYMTVSDDNINTIFFVI